MSVDSSVFDRGLTDQALLVLFHAQGPVNALEDSHAEKGICLLFSSGVVPG